MNSAYIQSANQGDNIICLHSSMSSSRQWTGLVERLQDSYQVRAIDLHGYGNGPELAEGSLLSLEREVALLADVINDLDGPVHLVGHSYGGAVAIKTAQTYGRRISSLTLYEPVVFASLFKASPNRAESIEVVRLIEEIRADYRSGGLFRAAQRFIDYWSGPGSWEEIPFHKQLGLSKKVPVVLGNFEAVVTDPNPLAGLAKLQIPTLFLSGRESPASVRAMSDLLKRELPDAARQLFDNMGHMGPITHSEIVNASIERFIKNRAVNDSRQDHALAA